MSDRGLQQPDGHISTAMLLLYADGEAGNQESAVAKHLRHCWACRERLEWINRGVLTFLDYYRDVLTASLPTAEEQYPVVLQAVRRELAQSGEAGKFRALGRRILDAMERVSVPAWITTIASVSLCVVLPYLSVVEPAHLTATDFLQRAVSAQTDGKTKLPAHRLVRIRRGQRVFDRKVTSADKPDPETSTELKLAGVDWENPLNPRDFAAWHRSVANPQDVIRESQSSITLETTLHGDAPVRFVSFTVSRDDWHPTGHHIEVPSQPAIDIDELPWEPNPISTAGAKTPSRAASPAAAAVDSPADGPSAEQLESTEVRLREVLRDLQGDFYAAPVIRREPQGVSVLAFSDSSERRSEVSEALDGIPYLTVRIVSPDAAPIRDNGAALNGEPAQQPASVARPTAQTLSAPLAENLRRYCGGLEQANSYLAAMAESHSETMMAASALRDLAARYSAAEWSRLSPGLQARLEHLVGDYESRLLRGARSYDALASPVLDAMLRDTETAPQAAESSPASCCLSWREVTPIVSEQVQRIQSILTRLFAGTGPDTNGAGASTKSLLSACDRARAQLKESLNLSSGKDSSQGHVP